jgi:hypothetical protein
MVIAGTIYATPDTVIPVSGAIVTLTDSLGDVKTAKASNCIGNFFISADDWQPAFPLRAEVTCPIPLPGGDHVNRRIVMSTRISRDGSCSHCHEYTGPDQAFHPVSGQTSPGLISCAQTMPNPAFRTPGKECQGIP